MEKGNDNLVQKSRHLTEAQDLAGFKSKSTECAPSETAENEKENKEPQFAGLSLASGPQAGSIERVQAPTYTDNGGKEASKRRSRHLTQPSGTLEYNVSGNETLASIAAKFDTTTSELKKLNKLMTQMIWPGQKLFVPDKDFIPSEHSSATTSPIDSPKENTAPLTFHEIPMIKQTSEPHKGPGLAKPVEPTSMPSDAHNEAAKISEEEARRLDEECYERFIKVGCKHITDGQGVVSGVLLVTPNAVMFDPNVSDPLIIEHGPNKYGLIAPMETIISVAMYHDISAMRLHSEPKNGNGVKSAIYHAANCPMSTAAAPTTDTPDLIKDIPRSRKRTQSMCSCGADSLIGGSPAVPEFKVGSSQPPLTEHTELSPRSDETATDDDTKTDCANTIQGNIPTAAIDSTDKSCDQSADQPSHDDSVTGSNDDNSGNTGVLSGEDKQGKEMDKSLISDSDIKIPSVNVEDTTKNQEEKQQEVTQISGESNIATPPSSSGNSPNKKQISTADIEPMNTVVMRGKGSSAAINIARNPSQGTLEEGSSSLLSRTIGSISSFGSFSNVPGFSTIVDYSTGLFVRNQDEETGKVKDVTEVSMVSPPTMPGFYFEEEKDPIGGESKAVSAEGNPKAQPDNGPIKVRNAMDLSEKPELFRSLDELIPKPAVQYVDPPLYLCIRVGQLKKRSSKTCPIESYNKTKHKPEYWFSIPKDKVDPLYAFFIQWSPELYGDEEDIDIEARGFVAVEDMNSDDDMEVIDDFYEQHPLSRARRVSLSKGWEVISSDVANLRNIDEIPALPELLNESAILKDEHTIKLCEELPPRAEGYSWKRLYSTAKDGFSLKTLYRTTKKTDSPVLLVVYDTSSQVFGAMLSCGPRMSDHFYGTGESYLFTFYQEFRVFRWTGANNFFIKGNMESMTVGAEEGSFGLWLDSDLYHGRTEKCSTYGNDLLTEREDFVISAIEAWTFV